MDRFTLRIRESKYSDRCPIHTTDITSSHGVRRTSRLKRTLNQQSRASLRITERELREAELSDRETISDLIQLTKSLEYYEAELESNLDYCDQMEKEYGDTSFAARDAWNIAMQSNDAVQWYKEKIAEL